MANTTLKIAPVWLVRAGGAGEDEEAALAEGKAIVGFRDVGDLRKFGDIDSMAKALAAADPSHHENRALTRARQLWALRSIAPDDVVVLPLKTRPGQIALGRASATYEFALVHGELRHTVPVKWLKPDLARTTFRQDLLYSFGAFLTICRIQRNNAAQRVAVVLSGAPDPGWDEGEKKTAGGVPVAPDDASAPPDHAQAAHDDIVAFVRKQFQSHDLARLVAAVLQADGYVTQVSSPGPDGGADILAGKGVLGLDGPTLCVQVKATEAAADVKVFRELIGTMDTFKAAQGLLVCWGGFTGPLRAEARQHVFKVKLWDQSELVNAIYRTYQQLTPDIQAEIPLQRVWALVREAASEE